MIRLVRPRAARCDAGRNGRRGDLALGSKMIFPHVRSLPLVVGGLSLALALSVIGADPPLRWTADAFRPLTEDRISSLPATEREAWRAYWVESETRAGALPVRSTVEVAPAGPVSGGPKGAAHTKGLRLDLPVEWYGSSDAAAVADRIVKSQTVVGAWTKGIDYTKSRPLAADAEPEVWSRGTFDNDATTTELRYLARVIAATADPTRAGTWRDALLRGLDYVFAAQYPNGGFPQVYPLAGGYHDAVTFNDSTMTHALELLADLAAGRDGFGFVPGQRREEALRRLARGVGCILESRIRTATGRRTIWGQQHDPLTLEPCAARNFEPISASAAESAEVIRFLMSLPGPSPEVVTSVEDAVAWLDRVALNDVTWDRRAELGSGLRSAPGSPRLWARLYAIDTDRPVFGDRDRTIHFAVTEISAERRLGYGWYGTWPEATLTEYRAWKKRRAWGSGRGPLLAHRPEQE